MSGMLVRLFERKAEQGNLTQPTIVELLTNYLGLKSAAGVSITPDSALRMSAVYACARILAESEASLPLILYRRMKDGGKERAIDHPLYPILHTVANNDMTSMTARESVTANQVLWGNGYAEILFDGAGRTRALWPMMAKGMMVKRDKDTGELVYEYREPESGGKPEKFPAYKVLHVPALGLNGIVGLSPIAMAREAIGLGLAAEEFGSRFFSNGANPGLVLTHPGSLSDDAYKRMKESWATAHAGVGQAHKPQILEEGIKVEKIGIPPDDAQFLETRKFQITEIARIFRVPPHMLADLDRATFSNIEQQSLDFVVHSLRPWLIRWEQSIALRLLTADERESYFAEHLVDGLLRGDIGSRYSAYATGRQWGWLSRNEVRRFENMNPIAGGDDYLSPLNMSQLRAADEELERETLMQEIYHFLTRYPAPAPPPEPLGNGRH